MDNLPILWSNTLAWCLASVKYEGNKLDNYPGMVNIVTKIFPTFITFQFIVLIW